MLKFFIWSLLEIYLFTQSVEYFGFFASVYFYLAPSLVGIFLLSSFQRTALMNSPNLEVHTLAKFLGSLLMIIPSFTTRIFAIFLLLPGLRHFILLFIKKWLMSKITQGGAVQFNFGGFSYQSKNRGPSSTINDDFIETTAVRVSDESLPEPQNNVSKDKK